jgi:putative SOS response-associated peptidase YedK
VIRENHEAGERALDLLGLIPHGCNDPEGGRKLINARAESVTRLPTFRSAYAKRRRAHRSLRIKDRSPFTIAGLWENWRYPKSGDSIRTVAI